MCETAKTQRIYSNPFAELSRIIEYRSLQRYLSMYCLYLIVAEIKKCFVVLLLYILQGLHIMQKISLSSNNPHVTSELRIIHFPLPGLLQEGHMVALGIETRTISLLVEGPLILNQVQLSDTEKLLIKAIFETFPNYCPYEVLLASVMSPTVTQATVARCRLRLQEAQNSGTWIQELRPIRRALSSLRGKLHEFNLEISTIRERGCNVTSSKVRNLPDRYVNDAG